MNLVQHFLTNNPCYKAGRKITVKGLMLHSVGCPQPRASAFINSWNQASYDRACVHGFIDALDGTAYQTLPWKCVNLLVSSIRQALLLPVLIWQRQKRVLQELIIQQ